MQSNNKKIGDNTQIDSIKRLLEIQRRNIHNSTYLPTTQRFKPVYDKLIFKQQMNSNNQFEQNYVNNLLTDVKQMLQSQKLKLLLKQNPLLGSFNTKPEIKRQSHYKNQSLPQLIKNQTQKIVDESQQQQSRGILKNQGLIKYQYLSSGQRVHINGYHLQNKFFEQFNYRQKIVPQNHEKSIEENQSIRALTQQHIKLLANNTKIHSYLHQQNQKDINFLIQKLNKQKIQAKNYQILKYQGIQQLIKLNQKKSVKKVRILEEMQ